MNYDHEAYRAEQDAKAQEQREKTQERIEKEAARLEWMADGGTSERFEKEWPKLRDEGRRRRVVDADKHARDAMRMSPTSRI